MDLVSVVIPYFKKREYIKRCIQSVLRQNYKKFEIIIVYDGEDFSDLAYIGAIVKKDKRIQVIKNDYNRGLGYSLNAAIKRSRADIIARMDTEDRSLPERLAKQFSFMKIHIDVDLLFTQWIDVNERDESVIRKPCKKDFINMRKSFFIKSLLMHPTLMARKKVFIDNPYQEMGRPEDIVLWFKLIRNMYVFDIIEEPLYMYRIDRINLLQRCAKTKTSSRNLLPHLVRESKYYWSNKYFWLFFGRTVFEYLISRNIFLFNITHARAAWLWNFFLKSK